MSFLFELQIPSYLGVLVGSALLQWHKVAELALLEELSSSVWER